MFVMLRIQRIQKNVGTVKECVNKDSKLSIKSYVTAGIFVIDFKPNKIHLNQELKTNDHLLH